MICMVALFVVVKPSVSVLVSRFKKPVVDETQIIVLVLLLFAGLELHAREEQVIVAFFTSLSAACIDAKHRLTSVITPKTKTANASVNITILKILVVGPKCNILYLSTFLCRA